MKANFFIMFFISFLIKTSLSYDYFIIAQQWPPSLCRTNADGCEREPVEAFRMHGVWPANKNGDQVTDCGQAQPFDGEKVSLSLYSPFFMNIFVLLILVLY
jgi:ribonuclease I